MRDVMGRVTSGATGWTVLGTDTDNLAGSTTALLGAYALKFDKVDGSDNKKYAGAYRTIDEDLSRGVFLFRDRIVWLVEISDLTNVDYAFVRLGSSSSNYAEWRFADTSLTAERVCICQAQFGDAYLTGTGLDWRDVDYLAVGVQFDAAGDALADIRVHGVWLDKVTQVKT